MTKEPIRIIADMKNVAEEPNVKAMIASKEEGVAS